MSLLERATRAALNLCNPYDLNGEQPSNHVGAYLKSNFRPLRRVLFLSVLVTAFAASLEVWLIGYIGRLIDALVETTPQDLWTTHGTGLILAACIVLFLRPLTHFLRMAINDVGFDCNMATLVRWRAHDHLAQQSVGWFQNDMSGRVAARMVDIGNHAADMVYQCLNVVAYGFIYLVGVVILMAGVDLRLAVPLILWIVLYFGLLYIAVPRIASSQQVFQSARSALFGGVVDRFSNFDLFKMFSSRSDVASDFRDDLESTRQTLFQARVVSISVRTIVSFLDGMIMTGFIGFGIYLWTTGSATIGVIGSALALSVRISAMAEWLLESARWIFMRLGSMREALKTIGQPIDIPNPSTQPLQVTAGRIDITDLTHHYGAGVGGLNELSLSIAAGEKVGVVGRSGAGKSTLVNLLLRFHEAEGGSIKIDGQDTREVEQDSLRAAMAMVGQQANLLHRTVAENIGLGRGTAAHCDIVAAAKKAHAHAFIQELDDGKGNTGYDVLVGERGVKLSGGQRQRVALARAILKDAPILILDEATSALDSTVEAQVQDALEEVMEGKTVLAIAHRLSTISQMDRIIVMDQGRIVEEGSHDALLEQDGLYAEFWSRQSGGYIDVDGAELG